MGAALTRLRPSRGMVPVLATSAALAGCGGGTKTVTVPAQATTVTQAKTVTVAPRTKTVTAQAQPTPTDASSAQQQNNQVVSQAAAAPDNQAQLGAAKIQQLLTQKLRMNGTLSFNLSGHIAPDDNGGDCYVKLGADAVNFDYQTQNILRSPNGADVVFVQSNTATPLVKCLAAVKTALGW